MSKEIQKKETETMQDALIRICQNPEIEPERLEKFLELQVKMEARQSEKEFSDAISNFQASCPIINKTKKVKFTARSGKQTEYDYAPLDEIVSVMKPYMKENGLSFRFNTENMGEESLLETTIRHRSGHTETTKYTFPTLHDDQRMTVSQRRKAALSFAKRTGLENALGICTQDEDAGVERLIDEGITDEQKQEINNLLDKTETDEGKFNSYMKIGSIDELSSYEAKKAITQLKQKRIKTQGAK